MTRFDLLTPESARGKARDLLGDLVARHGQVGDMVRTMAHSPALLASYLDLSRAMIRTKLDRGLSERVSVAVQAHLGCQTCLDAHTEAARQIGLSDDEIDAARRATSPDARIDALLRFALTVATEPARVGDPDLATLRDHGYADREILDVVGIVALNQLTGTLNLVAGL